MLNKKIPALASGLALSVSLGACAHQSHNEFTNNDVAGAERSPASYVIQGYPILQAIEASGQTLAETTKDWMKKWDGMDLDDSTKYQFKELSGSTSINLKIQKIDPTDPKGYKSRGSFVARNGAANPDTEIAYFQMSAIFGYDHIFRPAARYELGPRASASFRSLINNASIHGSARLENKASILKAIGSGNALRGCVKAKKNDTATELTDIANSGAAPNGAPRSSHPVIASIQAGNPKPQAGTQVTLKKGYVGDALELAREYSVIMTLDAIFGQWDRYSGGNVVIMKDKDGHAHFYATDNGGADVNKGTSWNEHNLAWFSRYDRKVVGRVKELYAFLNNPASGYLGYTSAERFLVDLGLYTQLDPGTYVERMKRNLKLFLDRVAAVEAQRGSAAYFD